MPVLARTWWRLAVASVFCSLLGCGGDAPPPNVLLVSIDSLRADHVRAYGHARETTPTIDRLAREGVRFETAIACSSWTLPTHATLLTGLPPEVHGVTSSTRALGPDALTVAEVLQARGYRTAGFVSGPYLRGIYGFGQGFDAYDESVVADGHLASHRGATSPALTRQVVAFLNEWSAAADRPPFFVFLHMWDVHFDYAPPPPYDTMFDPDYAGTVTADDFVRNREVHPDMAPRDLEHVIALYDGEIRYTDEHLGRIVARLEALGVLDDTIVVVTADHGEEFFEHGRKGHDARLYDELLRIPLVIRYPPRVPAGQVAAWQVRQMDVAPTLLGLAGVPAPPGFGGTTVAAVDVTRWITGAATGAAPLPAFASTAAYDGSGRNQQHAVRTPRAKYVEVAAKPAMSLYFDLAADPGERTNLLAGPGGPGDAAARLGRLRTMLRRWSARHPPGAGLSHDIEIDAEQRTRLLQLGYIE